MSNESWVGMGHLTGPSELSAFVLSHLDLTLTPTMSYT